MKRLLTICADGFEETEMIAVVDVMRRLNADVTIAGLSGRTITGAHGVMLNADAELAAISPEDFDGVFLPGGMPGAAALYDSEAVVDIIRQYAAGNKVVSAICAAPMVLAKAGVLTDGRFTMYPGFEKFLGGLRYSSLPAERAGNVVTGRGPGAVFAFAAQLAAAFGLEAECRELFKGMFVEL